MHQSLLIALEKFSIRLHALENDNIEIPDNVDALWRDITDIVQEEYNRRHYSV